MIFPPAFLDSSSWHTNQLQPLAGNNITGPSAVAGGESNLLQGQDGLAAATGTLPEGGGGGGGGDGSATPGTAKPMTMSERARLARIPQPEPGLKCPRCDSTNTKFCYFNNYSLSQPRHFCRACRRYWTRGGALRNVPVGGGYRRHAKRAKPKATASAAAAASASAVSSTAPSTCTSVAPTLQAMLGNNASSLLPPLHRFTDFDTASLGLSFPGAAKLFVDTADAYAAGGGSSVQGMEQQWRAQAQMQSFPFLHAMDHQMGPATAMPATMAMQGMFHLGLESGGGGGRGVNSEDGGEFHVTPTKREEYPRGMYGDDSGYTSYSSSTAGAGNLL